MNSTLVAQEIPRDDHDDRIPRTQRLTADTGPPSTHHVSACGLGFCVQQPGTATEG
jgi:hypothetical protein